MTRPNTPDRVNEDGSTTIKTKRACNGCSELLGDITDQEMNLAINGGPLPDVRRECPNCAPTAPEPACRPVTAIGGDALCVEMECGHELDASGYCQGVKVSAICVTHSEINDSGEITRAEPWPCTRTAVTA
ncbi:hypothetical protein ACFYOF_16775 [Streptomyces sp. NPDC007148]|uniref:hypothetical protein n=1 Tax=Streptomyces sp. NPDC007148 TaxID=3364775 RepID=UPI0036CB7991